MNIHEALQDKTKRYELCKHSLYLFAIYYFGKYFTHISPEFHKDRCKIKQRLGKVWEPRYMVDCEFRGSAKTSLEKIDFIRRICYKDREMMLYGSVDKKNAENALLDIAIELQTNPKILLDFWQLFFDTENKEKKSKKSWVSDFLTANWIRVQAITTGQPIRWLIFWPNRPDYIVYDDFETNITKKSNPMTRKVIEHFDEMFPAIAPHGIVVFLCNKISDTGSVAWLYDKLENNHEWVIFEKSVLEDWEITWKDKYVKTDKEANDINKERPSKKWVLSLESVKRTLNKDWRNVYEQEMLNIPLVDGERFFDIDQIDSEILRAKELDFEKDGHWKIWEEYDPMCDYKISADVSEWYWLDSSVIEVLNITNGEQAAEFENNLTTAWDLADEMISASNNYWKCSVTPERNSIGNAVITSIQEKQYGHLLTTQKVINKKGWGKENRFGWYTNSTSKPKMLFDLQRDFNDGSLTINSLPLLREMRAFANGDMKAASFDEEVSNHFDRVMAMAIWNQTRSMIDWFAIKEKRVKIWEDTAVQWVDVKFRGGKWRADFKR